MMPVEWVMVPVEPTEAMLNATKEALSGVDACVTIASVHGLPLAWHDGKPPLYHAYKAMLSARPAAPPGEGMGTTDASLRGDVDEIKYLRGLIRKAITFIPTGDECGNPYEEEQDFIAIAFEAIRKDAQEPATDAAQRKIIADILRPGPIGEWMGGPETVAAEIVEALNAKPRPTSITNANEPRVILQGVVGKDRE